MVRTHKIVEKNLDVHVLFYIDGVQVGASVFPGGNCDIETQSMTGTNSRLPASLGGVGFDSVESRRSARGGYPGTDLTIHLYGAKNHG